MKSLNFPKPLKHIIVCVNEKEEGDCCIKVGGMELFLYLKEFVRANGLTSQVWVTKARCLGFCNNSGPTAVIYPEGKWFLEIEEKDYEKIAKDLIV